MKSAPLIKVTVAIAAEVEEAVMELFGELFGQPASVYTDAETQRTTASVYLADAADWSVTKRTALKDGLQNLKNCGLDVGAGRISVAKVRREDWAESWKRHFKAIEIGGRLLIKPSWIKRKPKRDQVVVILDPGLSFGTGQHPTTRFCLEQMVVLKKQDGARSFLDIGTGSGILAIAAAKLGYRPVDAFDFDPESVRVARANARHNDMDGALRISRQDLTRLPVMSRQQYDLVCANLIYDLLLAERPRILARLKPTGQLVLAGILATQFRAVRHAYEQGGLRLLAHTREKEWESGAFEWK